MAQPAITYRDHIRASLWLGVPLIGSHLAQVAITLTDTIMLGRYDVSSLAAVTIAGSMFFTAFLVGAGFGQAVTPLVAEAVEAGDDTQVRRFTRMGLWLSTIYGVIVMIPFFWTEDILLAIGQTPEVASLGHDYLLIAIWGLIPALWVMTLKSYLAALEHTGIILWATVATAILNVFLNYVLIFGHFGAPELGVKGAAIASVIMQVLTVLILFGYGLQKLPQYALLKNVWKSDVVAMVRVYRLGWPIGTTSFLETGLFFGCTMMMGWIGTVELAAHGIALQSATLVFVIHVALSQTATVRAGRAFGRKDRLGLHRGAITVTGLSVAVVVLTAPFFLIVPDLLVSIFISPDETQKEAVRAVGVLLLAFAAAFQFMDAMQVIALGLLRGLQDTRIPMVMAAVSYWLIGLPVSYIVAFPLGYGPGGIWVGLVVGLLVAAILLMRRFFASQHI